MARSPVATDNGALTGGNWTQLNAVNWGSVTGGTVFSSSATNTNNESAAVWSGSGSFSNDQYAEVTISGLSFQGSDYVMGVIVRASTDVDTARDFYFAYVAADSSGPNYTAVLGKVVNGTRSVLHSASMAWSDSDTISLEVVGTSLSVFQNGTAIGGSFTTTDTDLSTGKPGLIANGSVPTGDDWVGGDITSGGSENLTGQGVTSALGTTTAKVSYGL